LTVEWRIELLDSKHDRVGFDCGSPPLDSYIHHQAGQDARRLVAKCFVACAADESVVAGFYTLAAAELPITALPESLARKLPRYPAIPVVRIGRLAVDRRYQGRGLGAILIANALGQVSRSDIGAFALIVDAKDERAIAFYRHFGFLPASDADKMQFLPLATAKKLLLG
jgi:ribosomal protein S18 acetylase RimI-like enzyme